METDNKRILNQFFEQLSTGEQEIIKDYLNEKSLESLTKEILNLKNLLFILQMESKISIFKI